MLADWLAQIDAAEFVATVVGKQPYARPDAARADTTLLTWATLDGVLADGSADVMTVARGLLADARAPRSADDVRRLMRAGVSTVIRAAERHDARLAQLAASFAQLLPGEVHVQLYATPGGTHSYGWHYDFEDVFIVQTAGIKDYYFRANTVARAARLGDAPDFSLVGRETSQLMMATLHAGDWLHIPRRWWHFVKCVEPSLSISVGMMPPEAFRDARRIPAGWSGPSG